MQHQPGKKKKKETKKPPSFITQFVAKCVCLAGTFQWRKTPVVRIGKFLAPMQHALSLPKVVPLRRKAFSPARVRERGEGERERERERIKREHCLGKKAF